MSRQGPVLCPTYKLSGHIGANKFINGKEALVASPIIGLVASEILNLGTVQVSSNLYVEGDTVKNQGLINNPAPGRGSILFGDKLGRMSLDNSGGQILGADIKLYARMKVLNNGGIIRGREMVSVISNLLDNKAGEIEGTGIGIQVNRPIEVGLITASDNVSFTNLSQKGSPPALENGVISAAKIHLGQSGSYFKANSDWKNVIFKTSGKIDITPAQLNEMHPDLQFDLVIIHLKKGENFKLTRPFKSHGSLEIVDDSREPSKEKFKTNAEIESEYERQVRELYHVGTEPEQIIEIIADVTAEKGIVIRAPDARIDVGPLRGGQAVKVSSSESIKVYAKWLEIGKDSSLASLKQIHLSAAYIKNVGNIYSDGQVKSPDTDLDVRADELENQKDAVISSASMVLKATKISNSGTIQISNQFSLQAEFVENRGLFLSPPPNRAIFNFYPTQVFDNSGGQIIGDHIHLTHVNLASGNGKLLNNNGIIKGRSVVEFVSSSFDNGGGLVEGTEVSLYIPTYISMGSIKASKIVRLSDRILWSVPSFAYKNGVITAPKIELPAGLSISRPNPLWSNMIFRISDSIHVSQSEFNELNPQYQPDQISIHLKKGENLKLTRPYETQGKLEIISDDHGAVQTIEILADIRAMQGLSIQAPAATVKVGTTTTVAPVKLEALNGEFSVNVRSIDLENAVVGVDRAKIQAPSGITIGRLTRDPLKESFISFYRNKMYPNPNDTTNLGGWLTSFSFSAHGQTFNSVYDGSHLVTLPMFTPNMSAIVARETVELVGPWRHYGDLLAKNLILDSSQDSVLEGSSVEVEQDLTLKNSGKLYLKRITGTLTYRSINDRHAFQPETWIDGKLDQVASDGAKLRVKGKAVGQGTIVNVASSFSVESSAGLNIVKQNFSAGLYQLIYEGTPQQRGALNSTYNYDHGHYGHRRQHWFRHLDREAYFGTDGGLPKAAGFYQVANGLPYWFQYFKANDSTPSTMIRRANGSQIVGDHSSDILIVLVGSDGGTLGSAYVPAYEPPLPPPVRRLDAPERINPYLVRIVPDDELRARMAGNGSLQAPDTGFWAKMTAAFQGASLPPVVEAFSSRQPQPVFFKLQSRFFHDEAKAQEFYREIHDHIVIFTDQGQFIKPKGLAIYRKPPDLLLRQLSDEALKTLNRDFIYFNRSMNFELLQELHRNASEYVDEVAPRGVSGPEYQKAIILGGNGQHSYPMPKKPMIFYRAITNEGGLEEFHPVPYFPPSMIREAHGRGGDRAVTRITIGVPEHFTQEQMIEHFSGNPAVQQALIRAFTENEQFKRIKASTESSSRVEEWEAQPQNSSSQLTGAFTVNTEVLGQQVGFVNSGPLFIHGAIRAKDTLLKSLFDDVTLESKKERVFTGNGQSYYERISQEARVHVDGILTILAGRDINSIGAHTQSGLESHYEALRHIWKVPVALLSKKVDEYFGKKKSGIEITHEVKQSPSSDTSLGSIRENAGESIVEVSSQLKAKGTISLNAGRTIEVGVADNSTGFESHLKGKKGGLGGKWETHQNSGSSQPVLSSFDGSHVEFQAGEKIGLTAVSIPGKSKATAPKVEVQVAPSTSFDESSSSKANFAWQKSRTSMLNKRNFVSSQLGDEMEVVSQKTLIQVVQGQTDFLDRIKQCGDGKVTYETLQEVIQETSSKVQGPTQGLAIVVGIGVGILTYGAGAEFAVATLEVAAEGVAEAMIAAGYSSVCSQAAVGQLSHPGNIKKTVKEAWSPESLKSLAVSMATAGAARGVGNHFGIEMKKPEGLLQHAERAFLNSTVGATMNVAIRGQDIGDALNGAVRTGVANTMGGYLANQVGEAYWSGDIDTILHKMAHAGIGAGMGAVISKDSGKGALAGATAAVAAEIMAEVLSGGPLSIAERIHERAKQEGIEHTPESFSIAFRDELNASADWARMAGAVANLVTEQDVNVGSMAANNALDNNFLVFAYYGAVAAGIAWSAYDFIDTLEKEGLDRALVKLGVDVAVGVAGGAAFKVVGKVGKYAINGKTFNTAKEALIAVLNERPALKLILSKGAGNIKALAEALEGTALGKGIAKCEVKIAQAEARIFGPRQVPSVDPKSALPENTTTQRLLEILQQKKGSQDVVRGTRQEAEELGRAWVDLRNAKSFSFRSGGYGLTDGKRTFRLQFKRKTQQWKANFQEYTLKEQAGRLNPDSTGSYGTVKTSEEVKNFHMLITDM